MKFTPEVIAALQTLKDNAVNDFELHRISVLEKDLTAPPKPQVIDDNHQKFNGEIFHKSRDGHYTACSSIHRAVFSYYFGDIPVGYEIHHVDKNKGNNDFSNLTSMSKSEHIKLHLREDFKTSEKICPICGRKFLSKKGKKVCSDTCYLKLNGIKAKCKHCGKEFLKYLPEQEFCSISCSTAELNQNKPFIQAKCINCGKEFSTKSKGALYCSIKCSNKYHYEHDREDRICVICGKTFNVYKGLKSKTCSLSCAGKLAGINRKLNAAAPVSSPLSVAPPSDSQA